MLKLVRLSPVVWRLVCRFEGNAFLAGFGSNRFLRSSKLQADHPSRGVLAGEPAQFANLGRGPAIPAISIVLCHDRFPPIA